MMSCGRPERLNRTPRWVTRIRVRRGTHCPNHTIRSLSHARPFIVISPGVPALGADRLVVVGGIRRRGRGVRFDGGFGGRRRRRRARARRELALRVGRAPDCRELSVKEVAGERNTWQVVQEYLRVPTQIDFGDPVVGDRELAGPGIASAHVEILALYDDQAVP